MNPPDLAELERLLGEATAMTLDEFSDASPEERIAAMGRIKRARDQMFAALPALIECAKAAARLVDELGCSIQILDRSGPDLTCADGEFLNRCVLDDRRELIDQVASALSTLGHPHG